jgi:hypothetical protein
MFREVATTIEFHVRKQANEACSNDFTPRHTAMITPFHTWKHAIGSSVSILRAF